MFIMFGRCVTWGSSVSQKAKIDDQREADLLSFYIILFPRANTKCLLWFQAETSATDKHTDDQSHQWRSTEGVFTETNGPSAANTCWFLETEESEAVRRQQQVYRRSAGLLLGSAGSRWRRFAAESTQQTSHLQQGVHTFSHPHVSVTDLLQGRTRKYNIR